MRSKTWIKDRHFEYQPGDIVRLVRKKKNGHPRALKIGESYKILKVENQDLFVKELGTPDYHPGDIRISKVNKDYFVPIQILRDEMIKDILGND